MQKKLIAILILPPLLAAIMVSIHVSVLLFKGHNSQEVSFTIKPGESFSSVNYRLAKDDIISNPRIFHYYAKINNLMESLKAGSFTIKKESNIPEVLDTFVHGTPELTSITIPEGKNFYEIAQILESAQITDAKSFIKLAKDPNLKMELGLEGPTLEGYLYPETYKFAKGTDAKSVIIAMTSLFKRKTKDLNWSNSKLSPHEVLTLASIVEKETGAKFERKTIAGVFLNRLQKRMRLQSDPTTIYGIWEEFNGNLQKKHLLEKTPYNTYKIPALPPGPICNPGEEAIKAVLNPSSHKYLYFVSKNDGTHEFTETYKQHRDAVDYWQKNSRNRKGKSWRDLEQN